MGHRTEAPAACPALTSLGCIPAAEERQQATEPESSLHDENLWTAVPRPPRPSTSHLLLPPVSGETSQTPDPYGLSPSILFIIFFQKILLKYSWFTMCLFLLYSNMIPFYIHMLFHYGLSWDIGYSSLCYTAQPCHLSMLFIVVCIC